MSNRSGSNPDIRTINLDGRLSINKGVHDVLLFSEEGIKDRKNSILNRKER